MITSTSLGRWLLRLSARVSAPEPATGCTHCKTGPATCQAEQKCQAAVLTDKRYETLQYVFADYYDTTAYLVTGEKDCSLEVRALAIGGGGEGGPRYQYLGGGGSGYPEFATPQLRSNESLNLKVGGSRMTSSIERGGEVLLIAAPGQSNDGFNGGNGYSGGGAGTASENIVGQDGGFDGGDGGDYNSYGGGKGSGLDVQTINMTRFVLTPGKGGSSSSGYGGGGGGILVNGGSPNNDYEYIGQGYGGGSYYDDYGQRGCVSRERDKSICCQ